jgi:hypothetical protein
LWTSRQHAAINSLMAFELALKSIKLAFPNDT